MQLKHIILKHHEKQHAASQGRVRLTFPIQLHWRNVTLWDGSPSSAHWPDVSWVIDGSLSWSQGIWWSDAGLGSVCHDVLSVEMHLGRIRDFCYRVKGQMMVTSQKWWWDLLDNLLSLQNGIPAWAGLIFRCVKQNGLCSSQMTQSGGNFKMFLSMSGLGLFVMCFSSSLHYFGPLLSLFSLIISWIRTVCLSLSWV